MLRPPMVERNYTHTCMYNCKSYSAREVSSVQSRSKEHDKTVFVSRGSCVNTCGYMQTSVTIWILAFGIQRSARFPARARPSAHG
jgi:hypothetical protein